MAQIPDAALGLFDELGYRAMSTAIAVGGHLVEIYAGRTSKRPARKRVPITAFAPRPIGVAGQRRCLRE